MTKEEILNEISKVKSHPTKVNYMGCREDWYNPFWAIKQTFTKKQLQDMSERELYNLVMLAQNISEGLY